MHLLNVDAEDETVNIPARALECPICLEILTNPISCKQCNKALCEKHEDQISECPLCREKPFKGIKEQGIRQLLNELPYPCKYCNDQISKCNLEVHELHCSKRPRHCGVAGCEFKSIESTVALRHLIDSHGPVIWENFTDVTSAGMKRPVEC